MKKLVLLLVLLTAAPASAGVVYVPLPGHAVIGDTAVEPRILVSNRDVAPHSFETLFLPSDSDGTEQGEVTSATTVAPGLTVELTTAASDRGLAQFESAPELLWAAKLVRPGNPLGFYLPVITSANTIAAGGEIHLLGWERSAGRATDLMLVNLGHAQGKCAIDVFRADGTQIRSRAVVTLAPLSSRLFEDGLAILGETALAGVRAVVSCDRPFFAFALIRDGETGEMSYLGPAGDGGSALAVPGEPVPTGCPTGAICFSRPGVFYVPRPQETIRRETFPIETGSYSKLHFRVEVLHGGWKSPASGLHSLFWLALNRHFRLIGFSGFHGPGANDVLFRHGMNLPAGDKPKFLRSFVATPGTTYVCDFVFDPVGDYLEYRILDLDGNVLLSIVDQPNVNRIHVEDGEDLVADFSSLLGANVNEPPTYGWEYKNLTLEVYP